MSTLPGKSVSLWMETTPATDYPTLEKGLTVDVAVIGGGISGLTTAALLKAAGKTVAVIEADRVGSGVTGHTTGKVTSLHQLAYAQLAKSFGKKGARIYGEANEAAIDQVERLVHQHGIDCDFHREDNYTYAITDEELAEVKKEADIARELGLPAEFTADVPLPFPVPGAVRFKHQASIHARRYCIGLARVVWGDGSFVFEQTRAMDVTDGEPCVVKTDKGQLKAADVVVATNVPFLDRGLFFARAHPYRSYVVAARVRDELPHGMYISAASDPIHSILPVRLREGNYLLVGGEGHKTGQGGNVRQRYQALADFARGHFRVSSIDYHWSTQDAVPIDGVPYIGRINLRSKHLYVITGLKKWGLSNGTAGAMILRDLITGADNPWAQTFSSTRLKPLVGGKKFVTENMNSGFKLIKDRLRKGGSLGDLMAGEGKVVRSGKEKVAVYKDEDGTVHTVSAICTHLGCTVEFNDAEQTWDCPCHGSRFTVDGKVIQGPANRDLEKRKI